MRIPSDDLHSCNKRENVHSWTPLNGSICLNRNKHSLKRRHFWWPRLALFSFQLFDVYLKAVLFGGDVFPLFCLFWFKHISSRARETAQLVKCFQHKKAGFIWRNAWGKVTLAGVSLCNVSTREMSHWPASLDCLVSSRPETKGKGRGGKRRGGQKEGKEGRKGGRNGGREEARRGSEEAAGA